jgi:hypothetical protein
MVRNETFCGFLVFVLVTKLVATNQKGLKMRLLVAIDFFLK